MIDYSDQLGSGVRNLFKYSKYYSGQEPQFIEGDVFRIIVPLDEAYSFDFSQITGKNGINDTNRDTIETNQDTIPKARDLKTKLLMCIAQDAKSTQKEYAAKLNVSVPTVKRLFAKLQKEKVLVREGTNRKGQWRVIEKK